LREIKFTSLPYFAVPDHDLPWASNITKWVGGDMNQPREWKYSQQDEKVNHVQLDNPWQRYYQVDHRLEFY